MECPIQLEAKTGWGEVETVELVCITRPGLAATVDDAGTRLFIPSRAEGDQLAVMDITPGVDGGAPIRCFFSGGNDCTVDAIQLARNNDPGQFGIPAAPQPYSVTLAPPPAEFCAQKSGAPRPADPSRRCGYGNVGANGGAKPAGNARFAANPLKRLKFPSSR